MRRAALILLVALLAVGCSQAQQVQYIQCWRVEQVGPVVDPNAPPAAGRLVETVDVAHLPPGVDCLPPAP